MKNSMFARLALSKEEMKHIRGGVDNDEECSVTCGDGTTTFTVTCAHCSAGTRQGLDCAWCDHDPAGTEKCCVLA